jgi:hypothetical protein
MRFHAEAQRPRCRFEARWTPPPRRAHRSPTASGTPPDRRQPAGLRAPAPQRRWTAGRTEHRRRPPPGPAGHPATHPTQTAAACPRGVRRPLRAPPRRRAPCDAAAAPAHAAHPCAAALGTPARSRAPLSRRAPLPATPRRPRTPARPTEPTPRPRGLTDGANGPTTPNAGPRARLASPTPRLFQGVPFRRCVASAAAVYA